ncbi:hypothetical protein V7S43_004891 [Phytophthora oleae]|uniref:Uncharacterized protein n=1 Tax=Phytophthora oleae TaxID=2107226 RepID=A0ABD3G048_9STRA
MESTSVELLTVELLTILAISVEGDPPSSQWTTVKAFLSNTENLFKDADSSQDTVQSFDALRVNEDGLITLFDDSALRKPSRG